MNRICPTLITIRSSCWMVSKMQKIFIPWQSLPGTILQKNISTMRGNFINLTAKYFILFYNRIRYVTCSCIPSYNHNHRCLVQQQILYICENQSSFASLHSFLHLDSIGWGQEFNGRDLEFEQILEWNNFCRYRIVALFYRSFLLCCSIYVFTIILTWT